MGVFWGDVGGTAGALVARMDPVFFSIKRAHRASLRFTQPLLKRFGLTPARLDALHALERLGRWPTQTALRNMLRVTRASVCEMLTTMERLGLVVRTRWRRTRRIEVTAKARAAYARVVVACMNSGFVTMVVDACLTFGNCETDPNELRYRVRDVTYRLRRAFEEDPSLDFYTCNTLDDDLVEVDHFVPNSLSPASPSPGMM